MKILIYILLAFFALLPIVVEAKDLGERLSGRILLQVENNGEAWYINPENKKKYFMGRPDNAFVLMYELGIGITNDNLEKIEIAEVNFGGVDSDGDGLADVFENSIGTNAYYWDTDNDSFSDKDELFAGYKTTGSGRYEYDKNFTEKHLGKIFLQVENSGEAWYVNPTDKKRYFLGRPYDAFTVMRALGLGIKNVHLNPIPSDEEYIKKFNERLSGNYDEAYNRIISGNITVPANVVGMQEQGVLEALAGKYSKDNINVYYNNYILQEADLVSFETFDDYYARDKNKVYLEYKVIEGADSATFQVLGFGYSLDKSSAYYKYNRIEEADPITFRLLEEVYAKDKNHVYFLGEILEGQNPETFSL